MSPNQPKRIHLARTPTPIELLPRLTAETKKRICFKRDDLTGSVLSGNKIRKLEFSLAEAQRANAQVIITAGGIQSNHCRATAIACARLGLRCHLVLRGSQQGAPDGNLLLDHLAGAEFSFFPQEVYSTQKPQIVERLAAQYAESGLKSYYIPVGASNAIGSWGYVRAYDEIMLQTERSGLDVGHIVAAVGSGGTLAGLIAGRAMARGRRPTIWGVNVCDDAPTFEAEIRGIIEEMNSRFATRLKPAATPINILDGYVGDGYAIPYRDEIETIRMCARVEGQILDPVYTGKAFHGMMRELAGGRFKGHGAVVFIHTGGTFGIFPQRDAFGFGPPACDCGPDTGSKLR